MAGEKEIVSTMGSALRSDILLAPHHGSRTSSSKVFLEMVNADLCIISSGRGNYFRFPHNETIQRLEESGCSIMRIDQSGAITLSFSNDGFNVETYLKNF